MPLQRVLLGDSFPGVRISEMKALQLDEIAVNGPYLLSYLLLGVIKAEALSLSIIALGWLNFQMQRGQVHKQTKRKKK